MCQSNLQKHIYVDKLMQEYYQRAKLLSVVFDLKIYTGLIHIPVSKMPAKRVEKNDRQQILIVLSMKHMKPKLMKGNEKVLFHKALIKHIVWCR